MMMISKMIMQTKKSIVKLFTLASAARSVKTIVIASKSTLTDSHLHLLTGYNQLRTDYVIQEGWPISKDMIDQDVYDHEIDSMYIIAYQRDYVLAGMRVTRVQSLEESLSYGMWQGVVEKDSFDSQIVSAQNRINQLHDYEIWDLTRLVTDVSILGDYTLRKRVTSRMGLYKVMGSAMKVASGGEKTAWIFTTTLQMISFLDRLGVPYYVLCRAKISETDKAESVLSIIYPHQALETIKARNRFLHKIVNNHLKSKV